MKKRIVGLLSGLFVGAVVFGACSYSYAATKILISPAEADKVGFGSAMIVVDVFSSGTTTTNNQDVFIGDETDSVGIAFHCPLNGVTLGTATFGIEESFDGTTFGSVTACEMVQTTNTLTGLVGGGYNSATSTSVVNAGERRGTNTSTFVGTLGTGTALTNQFYIVKPVGKILRFNTSLTASGTDTVKFKILVRKMQSMNKF